MQKDLGIPVTATTKGEKPLNALKAIVAGSKLAVTIDLAVEKNLLGDDPVRDELRGLSRGTALACLLRPVGAVLMPRKPANKEVEFWITDGKNSNQFWPVGWTSDEQLSKQAPKMLDTLNAEIDGVTAAEALEAVRQRVELPVLIDYNSLGALKDVDLNKEIKLPPGKTFYFKLLRDVLGKVNCKHEAR